MAAAIARWETVTIAALWFFLAGLMLAGRRGRKSLLGGVPGLAWLGEISYSYYMSFALVETLQATVWRHFDASPRQHPVMYVLTTTALTLGVATVTWRLVEMPALRAYATFTRRRAAERVGYPARP